MQMQICSYFHQLFHKIYLFSPEKVRFLIIGSFNTLIGLGIFPFLIVLLPSSIHYLHILIVSQVLSISISFITNKLFVFQSSGTIKTEYPKFIIFHGIHLGLNLIALPTLVHVTGLSPIWAQNVFALCVIVTSYFWHRDITFRKNGEC